MPKISLPENALESFSGYLALGMYEEANDELENLATELKVHPLVLSARLDLLMERTQWEEAAILAESLCKLWPNTCEFFIRWAFCLHELKQTSEARATLLNGPSALREQAVFHYNLACYESQLGDLTEAKRLLSACFKLDKSYKAEALDDPDLAPLWDTLDDSEA